MIPSKCHFCWIGRRLPYAYALAIRSAAIQGQIDHVILHHTEELENNEGTELLRETPGVELRRIDPEALIEQTVSFGSKLVDIYRSVCSPVSLSNMLRAVIVVREGGIYLDLDTVTVRSLRPLLEAKVFLGLEHIVRPYRVHTSGSRLRRAWATTLSGVRNGLRVAPGGYRLFPWISFLYSKAINGAILGAEPRNPLLIAYLQAMTRVLPEQRHAKHALGTHLLQQTVEGYPRSQITIHPPCVFYPIAPEISEHLFRWVWHPNLSLVIGPQTRAVHWYASGRTAKELHKVCPEYIRRHRTHQLYSAMVSPSAFS